MPMDGNDCMNRLIIAFSLGLYACWASALPWVIGLDADLTSVSKTGGVAISQGAELAITLAFDNGEVVPKQIIYTTSGLQVLSSNNFRKRMGGDATIEFENLQFSQDTKISITTHRAKPETLERLLAPASRQLLLAQLTDDKQTDLIQLYQKAVSASSGKHTR